MRRLCWIAMAWIVAAALPAGAEPPPAKDWEARLTPYGWLTRVDGSIEVDGRSQDFAAGIGDVLSHLGGGGMLNAGFRWRRFLLLGDLVYARLTDDVKSRSVVVGPPPVVPVQVGPLAADITFKQLTVSLNAGYRVLDLPFPGRGPGDASDPRRLFVDAYMGARLWYFKQEIDIRIPVSIGGMPLPPGGGRTRSASGSAVWADPQIGVSIAGQPWERWSFLIGGGVGGFGIGSASKLAWTGVLEASRHLGEHWSLVVAYKGLGFDRDFDGGNLDIAMHGPLLGASYRF